MIKNKWKQFTLIVAVIALTITAASYFKFFPFERIPYLAIPVEFNEQHIPYTQVEIEGKTCSLILDLGSVSECWLRKELLDQTSKVFIENVKWMDVRGHVHETKEYIIPKMKVQTSWIKDVIIREESYMEESPDSRQVEQGVFKFIEWLRSGKLEIKVYPSQNIHAKVYIVTFPEGFMDVGRVITGSSNLTQAGLVDNLEFNVELKNSADHTFAKEKFEELWKDAVDVSEKYIETLETRTWLNQDIAPYHLYLKLLYEYFKDELNQSDEVFASYVPENFMKLEYQEQAVLNAKKILEEYGGVFIADVVGLGKTYIATLLAGQLDGRTLVIAPPVLLDKDNPGSWTNSFSDFRVAADFESIGKLDDILERDTDKYANIIIDEAHRFRTETNITYENLAEICRGKRVILVTATPYNNSPLV